MLFRSLEPKAFHLKENRDSKEPHGPKRYGFLAQDVLALEGDDPVVINDENPDRLSYMDSYLTPILVNAIKELAAENAELKARIEALEAKG